MKHVYIFLYETGTGIRIRTDFQPFFGRLLSPVNTNLTLRGAPVLHFRTATLFPQGTDLRFPICTPFQHRRTFVSAPAPVPLKIPDEQILTEHLLCDRVRTMVGLQFTEKSHGLCLEELRSPLNEWPPYVFMGLSEKPNATEERDTWGARWYLTRDRIKPETHQK